MKMVVALVIVAVSFGLNLMPAYLDYKFRTVPTTMEPEYFGLTVDGTSGSEGEETTDVEAQAV